MHGDDEEQMRQYKKNQKKSTKMLTQILRTCIHASYRHSMHAQDCFNVCNHIRVKWLRAYANMCQPSSIKILALDSRNTA